MRVAKYRVVCWSNDQAVLDQTVEMVGVLKTASDPTDRTAEPLIWDEAPARMLFVNANAFQAVMVERQAESAEST